WAPAVVLLLPRGSELVLGVRLRREPHLEAVPGAFVQHFLGRIRLVQPRIRIPRILVREDAGGLALDAGVATGEPEPYFVLHDRAAEGGIDVPVLLVLVGRDQPQVLQPTGEVVALHAPIREREKAGAVKG